MTNFSISQFTAQVQAFIESNGIDDGNKVIEKDNGELAKVLNHFGLEEAQIGDLLEKADNTANGPKKAGAAQQPSANDVQKAFINSYKKYNNMSETQQADVRQEVLETAVKNYGDMKNAVNTVSLTPLYNPLADYINDYKNGATDSKELNKEYANRLLANAEKQCKEMEQNIAQYDSAFGKYDVTYKSPFKMPSVPCVQNLPKNIAEFCMQTITAKVNEYLAKDTSSLTPEENLESFANLYSEVNEIIGKFNDNIESNKEKIMDKYEEEYKHDKENLTSDNPECLEWEAPLGGGEKSFEYINITSSSIKKTFSDVVDSTATGIASTEVNNRNNPNAPIYDLGGRQVTKESLTQGQIYIQNGKKFVAQ